MKSYCITLILAASMILSINLASESAHAEIITFDDIPAPAKIYDVHRPTYHNLVWSPSITLVPQVLFYDFVPHLDSPSGHNAVVNIGDVSVEISGMTSFQGAYFMGSSAANGSHQAYTSTSVTIEGWDGNSLVGTVSALLELTSFNFVGANFTGIDHITIKNDLIPGTVWIMDDFQFNAPASAVPEPSSFALLGLGGIVAAIGAYRRRRAAV